MRWPPHLKQTPSLGDLKKSTEAPRSSQPHRTSKGFIQNNDGFHTGKYTHPNYTFLAFKCYSDMNNAISRYGKKPLDPVLVEKSFEL